MTQNVLISRNPATGAPIGELPLTDLQTLSALFDRARLAQQAWGQKPVKERAKWLLSLREVILNRLDEVVDLISLENGKPKFEALANELLPCIDLLGFYAKHAPIVLKDQNIPMGLMRHRSSSLNYWPLGVVTVISPWNMPFLIPFGEIIMSLVSGNAVIFKPSELTPLVGLKIQQLCEEAGLPSGVLTAVFGDGSLGSAIIKQRPAKIFFTGSVPTGKKIMASAAEFLIPVSLELGGKDAMIVLPDADLDFATSAALWGGYCNSGQVCASVERLLVHEEIAEKFTGMFLDKASKLRQGSSENSANDLGPITMEKQKAVYESQIKQAREHGATFVTGGAFSSDHRYLKPTLVTGPQIESQDIYSEETFGPVIAMTTFRTVEEAIKKANDSKYGLLASVITRNHALGEQVARSLEVGTVTINEVTYTAGLSETPWGGLKESGFGRTHSAQGLHEFVNVRHIHRPKYRLSVFKSLWWFPYTPFQYAAFRQFFELFRRHWFDKIKSLPHLLWNFAQFLKREKRL